MVELDIYALLITLGSERTLCAKAKVDKVRFRKSVTNEESFQPIRL